MKRFRYFVFYFGIPALFVLVLLNALAYKQHIVTVVKSKDAEISQNFAQLHRLSTTVITKINETQKRCSSEKSSNSYSNGELMNISDQEKLVSEAKKNISDEYNNSKKYEQTASDSTLTPKDSLEYCMRFLSNPVNGLQSDILGEKSYQPVPDHTSDENILALLEDGCETFGKRFFFMTSEENFQYVTKEERNYPIAYSIVTHRQLNQLSMLLGAIYRTQNLYCIHVDAKSNQTLRNGVKLISQCFPNIFLSSKTERVIYASFSRLQADVNCMRDLLAVPKSMYNWNHCINLCGQDFPVSTNYEIVQQLKALKGKNTVAGTRELNDIARLRTDFVYRVINVTNERNETIEVDSKTFEKHRPPPYNMTVIKNLAYNTLTRKFLQWALVDSKEGADLLNWSSVTHTPDEHFWGMLNAYPGAPGGSSYVSWWQVARAVMWKNNKANDICHGYWVRGVCVLGAGDLPWIMKVPQMFVNKFDVTYDVTPVTCIRTFLKQKTIEYNSTLNNNKKPLQLPWQMLDG
ncbi:N-acetyllactosaminide beta-1,6-N-acetylglucosaminyl-transferase-like [Styela clava]